jgi:acetyl esterase/lipase
MRAGVPTDLRVYPCAYHGFPMAGDSELFRQYFRDCKEALAAALSPTPADAAQ